VKLVVALAVLSFGLVSCQTTTTKDDLKTPEQKVSYSIGVNLGKNLKKDDVKIDLDVFMAGIKDAIEKDSGLALTDEEMSQVMMQFQQEMMAKQQKKQTESASKNKKDGQDFLEKNKSKDGVKVLPSGLQYKIIKSGNGPSPKATDKVKTHYVGRLINGQEFDNSISRGEPATFEVKGVIPGWVEALQLMKVGDKWELFIPADLAYGDRGAGEAIPPGAALIFEVELLEIVK